MSDPYKPPAAASISDAIRTGKPKPIGRIAFACVVLLLFVWVVYPFDHSDVYLVEDSISGPLWWVASPDAFVRFSAILSVLALLTGLASPIVRPGPLSLTIAATAAVLWLAIGYLHVVLLSP